MRVVHHVAKAAEPGVVEELVRLGVGVDGSGSIVAFDISEDDPRWPAVARWITQRNALSLETTHFTEPEIAAAEVVALTADWHHGYPQPERDFEYLRVTYDPGEICMECGGGRQQVAPFRLNRQPRWGRRHLLQLNWVFDELFVQPDVYHDVFKPLGIQMWPVLNSRGDRELDAIVQLKTSHTVPLDAHSLSPRTPCGVCDRPRFVSHTRGHLPSLIEPMPGAMAKTTQAFGSDGSTYHQVLVTATVWKAIASQGLRGVTPWPVAHA